MVSSDADGLRRTQQRTLLQILELDELVVVMAMTTGIHQGTSTKDRHNSQKLMDPEKIHLACTTSRPRRR